MSASVICHGCGQELDVPAGSARRKMRCPHCGVICDLPDPARAASAAPRPARRPAAPPPRSPEPAAEEALPRSPAPRTCPRCGAALPAGGPGKCPRCAPASGIKPAAERVGVRPGRPAARPAGEPQGPDLESSDSYGVVGGLEEPKCPSCSKPMAADAVVCVECGFNRQTGKKPEKVYEPMERHWEAGMALNTRILLFVGFQAAALPLGLMCAILFDEVPGFLFCWLLGTGMAAFVLGTFDRVDLERNKRGRVTLTKTWRVCFIPKPTETIRVSQYEGIVTGQYREVAFMDWLVLIMLLPVCMLPAFVWYFYAMSRDNFQVALAREHGYPELVLYRGRSEDRMREMAQTLREATGMPWDGA